MDGFYYKNVHYFVNGKPKRKEVDEKSKTKEFLK
jgi:hypothetical protein